MDTDSSKSVEEQIREIFFMDTDGWALCSTKATEFTEKFKAIVLDDLGNHPLGEYEYISDCACMLDNGYGHNNGCGCSCHARISRFESAIRGLIRSVAEQVAEKVIGENEFKPAQRQMMVCWVHYEDEGPCECYRRDGLRDEQRQALTSILDEVIGGKA